ncbi:MAG: response regulator, partial [Candidatus Obscuribacterales bacterium]|nr:response regulator [Candidatus Obscuribacterales bacterium]
QQEEFAGYISDAAQSLLLLINDILDLSKIEVGKLDLESVDFELTPLTEGMTSLLTESAGAKGLSLTTTIDPAISPVLKSDPGRLRQILLNLASNAIKFTDSGAVNVSCMVSEDSSLAVGRTNIMFSISDTGIGISASQLTNLFKPFSPADGTTTRRYGGTGLGLSISKRLVELMGGEIGVTSELSKGSTFWFKVPLITIDSASGNNSKTDDAKPRILVIDDQTSTRKIMQCYVNSWNMDCDVATSGNEGLALMRASIELHRPYDIVITDLVLPGMDGFQLKEVMNRDKLLSKINTVLIVGNELKDQGKQAVRSGFSAYLAKPLEQASLYNAISQLLTHKKQAENKDIASKSVSVALRELNKNNLILVVEDNPVNQKVATLQLRQLGLSCVVVANGQAAVDEVAKGIYSLVLMDCQMPVMDGFGATRAIRDAQMHDGVHIPIVGLTAFAMEADRDRCLAAGMDDYLSKPSSVEKLSSVLQQWLPFVEERRNTPKIVSLPKAG